MNIARETQVEGNPRRRERDGVGSRVWYGYRWLPGGDGSGAETCQDGARTFAKSTGQDTFDRGSYTRNYDVRHATSSVQAASCASVLNEDGQSEWRWIIHYPRTLRCTGAIPERILRPPGSRCPGPSRGRCPRVTTATTSSPRSPPRNSKRKGFRLSRNVFTWVISFADALPQETQTAVRCCRGKSEEGSSKRKEEIASTLPSRSWRDLCLVPLRNRVPQNWRKLRYYKWRSIIWRWYTPKVRAFNVFKCCEVSWEFVIEKLYSAL